jgi:2,3-bisphosphoglycerate-dependent phosphoglycerate mutase
MEVEIDDRLAERNLGEAGPDWMGSLSRTFDDLDLVFPGGESSRQAVARAVAALQDVVREGRFPVVMTSHGNLTTLALNHFDTLYDFSTWQEMSNPDVYFLGVLKYGMAVFRQWRS